MNSLLLKKGREKSLKRRHPWMFSGAIEKVDGSPRPARPSKCAQRRGEALALAAYSPHSQIRARVWTFDAPKTVDAGFFRRGSKRRCACATRCRRRSTTNALRLVHGESDGLPGLVVDRYADVLVAQFLAAGVERWREEILDLLVELTGCEAVFERSDAEVRKLEGLQAARRASSAATAMRRAARSSSTA